MIAPATLAKGFFTSALPTDFLGLFTFFEDCVCRRDATWGQDNTGDMVRMVFLENTNQGGLMKRLTL